MTPELPDELIAKLDVINFHLFLYEKHLILDSLLRSRGMRVNLEWKEKAILELLGAIETVGDSMELDWFNTVEKRREGDRESS